MTDTRKDPRGPVALKVRYKSNTVEDYVEQESQDLSRGGIFVRSAAPLPVATILKFEIEIEGEARKITGVGRVVWKRDARDAVSAETPSGMGIKFIKLDPVAKDVINALVHADKEDTSKAPESVAAALEQAGKQFFPDTSPAKQPAPEDRTQVRHTRDLLTAAFAEAGISEAVGKAIDSKPVEAIPDGPALDEALQDGLEEHDETTSIHRRDPTQSFGTATGSTGAVAVARTPKFVESGPTLAGIAPNAASAEGGKPFVPAFSAPPPSASSSASGRTQTGLRMPDLPSTPPEVPVGTRVSLPSKDAARLPGQAHGQPHGQAHGQARGPSPAKKSNSGLFVSLVALGAAALAIWWFATHGRRDASVATAGSTRPIAISDPVAQTTADPASTQPAAQVQPTPTATQEPPTPVPTGAALVDILVQCAAPAEVFVGAQRKGVCPQTLALPVGVPTNVRVTAPMMRTFEQIITPQAEVAEPIRVELAALPWRVTVTTIPAGATARIAGRMGVTPAQIDIPRVTAPWSLVISLPGYQTSRVTVGPDAFLQTPDAMLATQSVSLVTATPARTPRVDPGDTRHEPVVSTDPTTQAPSDNPPSPSDNPPSDVPTPSGSPPPNNPTSQPPTAPTPSAQTPSAQTPSTPTPAGTSPPAIAEAF